MINPIPDAEKFLNSLNLNYKAVGKTLRFETASISVEPDIASPKSTTVVMTMVPILDPGGVRCSFLLFVVVNAVMGKTFNIEGFFEKFNQHPLDAFSESHEGVQVTFTPTPNLWKI